MLETPFVVPQYKSGALEFSLGRFSQSHTASGPQSRGASGFLFIMLLVNVPLQSLITNDPAKINDVLKTLKKNQIKVC